MIKNNFNEKSIKNQTFVIKFGAQSTHFGYVKSSFASSDSSVKILGFHHFYLLVGVLMTDNWSFPTLALETKSRSLVKEMKKLRIMRLTVGMLCSSLFP